MSDNNKNNYDKIETVGIKTLGSAVSSYIRKASLGVRILVSDRGRIVAEIAKPFTSHPEASANPALDTLVNSGQLKLASSKKLAIEIPNIKLKSLSSKDLLDQLRSED